MTIFALLADIHGNLPALESVLNEIDQLYGPIPVYCLGDIVGYYTYPNECIDLLRRYVDNENYLVQCVKGNHDYFASRDDDEFLKWFNPDAKKAMIWTRKNISQKNKEWLSNLNYTIEGVLPEFDQRIFFVHASPINPLTSYLYKDSDDLIEAWLFMQERDLTLLFVGHTHIPNIFPLRDLKKRWVINPGSVGQPRDGNSMASYAIVSFSSPDDVFTEIRRVKYDMGKTIIGIVENELPVDLADRLGYGQ